MAPSARARFCDGRSTRSGGSAFSAPERSLTPMPSRRYFVPSVSFSSRCNPVWKMRSASRVGSPSWRLRVLKLEILRLQLEHHRAASDAGLLQPCRDLLRERAQHRHEIRRRGQIGVEGGFRRYALGVAVGMNRALVLPARQMVEPVAHDPVAAHQLAALDLLQLADRSECRRAPASRRKPCRRPRSASPAARRGKPALPPRR